MTDYHPDQMIDTRAAASLLGMKPNTLEHWRTCDTGPKYSRYSRHVKYRVGDLRDFIAANTVTTSEQK